MDVTTIVVPTLVTDRLILRCWQPSDLEPYSAMNQDAETMSHLGGVMAYAQTERLVTHLIGMWHLRGFGMWALEHRVSGEFVGRAGLYQTSEWPAPEAAWSIRRDLWGQGLATEAGAAVLRFGFTRRDMPRIISLPARDNRASVQVAAKLGMTFTEIAAVGPWRDSAVYEITKDAWSNR